MATCHNDDLFKEQRYILRLDTGPLRQEVQHMSERIRQAMLEMDAEQVTRLSDALNEAAIRAGWLHNAWFLNGLRPSLDAIKYNGPEIGQAPERSIWRPGAGPPMSSSGATKYNLMWDDEPIHWNLVSDRQVNETMTTLGPEDDRYTDQEHRYVSMGVDEEHGLQTVRQMKVVQEQPFLSESMPVVSRRTALLMAKCDENQTDIVKWANILCQFDVLQALGELGLAVYHAHNEPWQLHEDKPMYGCWDWTTVAGIVAMTNGGQGVDVVNQLSNWEIPAIVIYQAAMGIPDTDEPTEARREQPNETIKVLLAQVQPDEEDPFSPVDI